jgi:hypothetical protein
VTRNGRPWMWALLLGLFGSSTALAGEFRFVATQIAPDRAIWQPSLVLIDNKTDLDGGLVFILENRTQAAHGFAVEGLSELAKEKTSGVENITPLSVTVGPNHTKVVRISIEPLQGAEAAGRQFRVRCPIHSVEHLPGSIFVIIDSYRRIP